MSRQDAKNAKRLSEPDRETDALAFAVIGAAIDVHRALGPGFLESVYERAMCIELRTRGIPFTAQAALRITYKGHLVGSGRIDLLVGGRLIVELKAVDRLTPLYLSQTISYLKQTNLSLALLINFNVPVLSEGVRRVARTQLADSWRSLRLGG